MSKYHRTAIARRKLSAPAAYLREAGLLWGRQLDYGSGRGKDAEVLGIEAFEPNGGPEMPEGSFDTIMCNYVFNVVEPEVEEVILADVYARLAVGGIAYITVRRDVTRGTAGYSTRTGTYQRWVELDLPIEREVRGAYCMYRLVKEESN